jgi:hypothetical protein
MKEPSDAAAVRVFPPAVPLLTILLGVAFNRLCPFNLKLSALSRYGIGGAIVGVAVLGLVSTRSFSFVGPDRAKIRGPRRQRS